MPVQRNLDFPQRVQRAVEAADQLAAKRDRTLSRSGDVTTSPEYQELVRLKVVVDVETSRAIAEAAGISAELERSTLAQRVASEGMDR
jgi:hypothetical protein